jgi:parvulin-like peptidyl-prolyl isomerase
MSLDAPLEEEPKDRTKLLWLAVGVLVAAMVAVMWVAGRSNPNKSTVRVSHILVTYANDDVADRQRALDRITSIRDRIKKGENFEKLAKEFSDDPGSRARGGDLNYLERGEFAPEIDAYIWTAPLGEISDIISTKFGFHVVKVTDRYVSDADRYDIELDQKARGDAATKTPGAKP